MSDASCAETVHEQVYARLNGWAWTVTPGIHSGKVPESATPPWVFIKPVNTDGQPKTSSFRSQFVPLELEVISDELDPQTEVYPILSDIRKAMTAELDLSGNGFTQYGSTEPDDDVETGEAPEGGIRHRGTYFQELWVVSTT